MYCYFLLLCCSGTMYATVACMVLFLLISCMQNNEQNKNQSSEHFNYYNALSFSVDTISIEKLFLFCMQEINKAITPGGYIRKQKRNAVRMRHNAQSMVPIFGL